MTNARLVIVFLGVLSLLDVAFMGLLALNGLSIPDVMSNLAFASTAALGAILAKTSGDQPTVSVDPPAVVTVTDGPDHRA